MKENLNSIELDLGVKKNCGSGNASSSAALIPFILAAASSGIHAQAVTVADPGGGPGARAPPGPQI